MPGLPWVRLDSNIYVHDKILRLQDQRDGWRAFGVYVQGLSYSGGHETDGFIPRHVLKIIGGTSKHAEMLIEHRLWEHSCDEDGNAGYQIRNWFERQEPPDLREFKARVRREAGIKGACVRWHGEDCGCWRKEINNVHPLGKRHSPSNGKAIAPE